MDGNRTVFMPRARVAIGTQLNGIYRIDSPIAAGGMGEVYKGSNVQTGDHVAIKMIRSDLAENEAALALFRKEASALRNLNHDAIVRYYIFAVDPALNRAYLAMEFVDGISLKDMLVRGPLPFEKVCVLQQRIASGLHAAHKLGIIHRDVSPDNVLAPNGDVAQAKILDFGIARSTRAGEQTIIGSDFAGKYNYVSPEQLGLFGGDVTARSDIYSLGLLLAETCIGRPLDMSGSQVDVIDKRRVVPDLSAVDSRLRPLLAWMLSPLPEDRPASMAEVAEWTPSTKLKTSKGKKAAGSANASAGVGSGVRLPMIIAASVALLGIGGAGVYFGSGLLKSSTVSQLELEERQAAALRTASRTAEPSPSGQVAEEMRKAAEFQRQEEARKAAEAAEAKRLADLQRLEEARKAAEAAEAKRQEEARKAAEAAEAKRLAELQRQEETRKAAEAAEAKRQEEVRKAAEVAETKRLAEIQRQEELRKAMEAADAKRRAELQRQEEARKAAEATEAKRQEEVRKAAEAAETKRLAELQRQEEARKAAEVAEAKRQEEARKVAEAAEAKRQDEARKAAEAAEVKRLAELQRQEEARKAAEAAEAKRQEEARKVAEAAEAKRQEEARKVAEAAEAKRLTELQRQEDARRVAEAAEAKRQEEARKVAEAAEAKRQAETRKVAEAAEARRRAEDQLVLDEQGRRDAQRRASQIAESVQIASAKVRDAERLAAEMAERQRQEAEDLQAAERRAQEQEQRRLASLTESQRKQEEALARERLKEQEKMRLVTEEAQKRWDDEMKAAMVRSGIAAAGAGGAAAPQAGGGQQVALADPNAAAPRNPNDSVRRVQDQLARLGCYAGAMDGTHSPQLDASIQRYRRKATGTINDPSNEVLLRELEGQSVPQGSCECAKGETPAANKCVAPARNQPAVREKPVQRVAPRPTRVTATRPAPAPAPRAAPAPAPAAPAARRPNFGGIGF